MHIGSQLTKATRSPTPSTRGRARETLRERRIEVRMIDVGAPRHPLPRRDAADAGAVRDAPAPALREVGVTSPGAGPVHRRQRGALLSRSLRKTPAPRIVVIDAAMNDLIRPRSTRAPRDPASGRAPPLGAVREGRRGRPICESGDSGQGPRLRGRRRRLVR